MNRTRLNLTQLEVRENPSGTTGSGPYTPPPPAGGPPPADTGTPSPPSGNPSGPYTPPPV